MIWFRKVMLVLLALVLFNSISIWNLNHYEYPPRTWIPETLTNWTKHQYGATCCESAHDVAVIESMTLAAPMLWALWLLSRRRVATKNTEKPYFRILSTAYLLLGWSAIHFLFAYRLQRLIEGTLLESFLVFLRENIPSQWHQLCCGPDSFYLSMWASLLFVVPLTWVMYKLRGPT